MTDCRPHIGGKMSLSEDLKIDLEALPSILQRKYSLLRDLDKSLRENQRQNDKRCEEEIEKLKRMVKSGNTIEPSLVKFSEEALEEQKHSVSIADEKVAIAQQVYDLVDGHIQQLDQYLKKYDEELRHESAATITTTVPSPEKTGRHAESDRRKKSRLAIAAATTAAATEAETSASNPTSIDLPVDPNEPTYCLCNEVSYGEMVACDNTSCKIEWFHFGCVGLKEQPRGKWYCSDCSALQKRRKRK